MKKLKKLEGDLKAAENSILQMNVGLQHLNRTPQLEFGLYSKLCTVPDYYLNLDEDKNPPKAVISETLDVTSEETRIAVENLQKSEGPLGELVQDNQVTENVTPILDDHTEIPSELDKTDKESQKKHTETDLDGDDEKSDEEDPRKKKIVKTKHKDKSRSNETETDDIDPQKSPQKEKVRKKKAEGKSDETTGKKSEHKKDDKKTENSDSSTDTDEEKSKKVKNR